MTGADNDILVGIITAADDNVTLSATNDITDGGTGKITAAILTATADSDTSGEGLIDVTTAVDSVTASAGETIDITEDDDITLTSLTTTNGTITVATVDGTITVAGAVSLDGNLLLDANGATSDINVNAATTTLGGTATLSADNSINFGASGSIDTDDGSGTGAAISLTADADTTGGDGDPLTITNGGAVIMADGSTVDAGDGEILIVADGDVRIGKLITTSSSSTAVTVTATSGNIVDGGEDDPDLDIDAAARGVVLTADGTIGEVTGFAVDPELEMNVGSLCINTGGDFILSDPDGIFVKEIIAGGNVSLTAVTYIDDLQDDTVTDITAGGTITLSAGTNIGGSPSAGTTTDTAGRLEVADGSDVTANADDVILLGANGAVTLTVANSTSSDVDVTASGTITATDVDADGAVTLNTTTGGIMAADVVAGTEVELSADAGDIQIGSVTSTGSNITVTATTGAITDKDADAAVDLTATIGSAILTAANGIGDADAIETSVEILDATNTVMGNIDINQTGELLIENIDQQGAGNVNVDGNDTITVDSSGSGITSMGGSVELDADGATSDINVDNTISSNGGAVNLLADNDVNFAEAGDVSTAGGNLTVSATGGQITMADSGTDTATIDAGAGTISLSADENIELGRLVTTNNTAGAVSVDSDNGAITDGGDTDGADIEATGADAVVTLNGATGIGDGDAIDLEVASVDVSNSDGTTATAAGNIDLNETDALSIVGIDCTNCRHGQRGCRRYDHGGCDPRHGNQRS
ncbi:MAG: hypothetical protein R3C59_06815 [Planctomycetaceae bacterium]